MRTFKETAKSKNKGIFMDFFSVNQNLLRNNMKLLEKQELSWSSDMIYIRNKNYTNIFYILTEKVF